MKIGLLNRLLLTIYTLVVAIISIAILVLFIAIGVNIIPLKNINYFLGSFQPDWRFFLVSTLVHILLVVSIKLLFSGNRPKVPSSALLNTDPV